MLLAGMSNGSFPPDMDFEKDPVNFLLDRLFFAQFPRFFFFGPDSDAASRVEHAFSLAT